MLFLSLALAQDIPDSDNIGVPRLDSDLLHRALATQHTLVTEDAGRIRDEAVGGFQLGLGYANAPLVVSWDTGSGRESAAVVRDAFAVDLIATLEYDRLRLGLDVPIYPLTTSDLRPRGASLGNIALDGRLTLLDPTDAPVGAALVVRVDLPSADADAGIASEQLGYEIAGVGERSFGDFTLALNAGWRGVPRTALYNVVWNDLLFMRLAGSLALSEQGGLSVEAVGATVPSMFSASPLGDPRGAPTPAELLAGGWFEPIEGFALRGAVGTGLSKGIGSPRLRALLDVVWTPRFAPRDADGDGVLDRDDRCVEDPEDVDGFTDEDGCPDWDNDADGIDDQEDRCPDEAEDVDGFLDEDGCPDPRSEVLIRVVDDRDAPVNGAILQVSGEGLEPTADKELELHPGAYKVVAFAAGYQSAQSEFIVQDGRDQVVRVVIERNPPGLAKLQLKLPSGVRPPAGLSVQIGDRTVRVVDGVAQLEMAPGTHPVNIQAFEPLGPWRGAVSVRSDSTSEVLIELGRPRLRRVDDRIELGRDVRFSESGSIAPQSLGTTGELAAYLYEHPALRVEITSRVTSRADAAANRAAALARVDSLKRWLVAAGIEGSRVVPEVSVEAGGGRDGVKITVLGAN